MTQSRKNELYEKMLLWISMQVKNDKELFQILHNEFGITQEEFHDEGIDGFDYLFEAQKTEDTDGRIAVYYLHRDGEDYHFTDDVNNTFFRAAKLYHRFYEREDKNLTIDSIAQLHFEAQQSIDPLTFSILTNAIENDDRVNVAIEIDFGESMMSVKDKSGVWKTYCLDDVLYAVNMVKRYAGDSVNQFSERMFCEIMAENEVGIRSNDLDSNKQKTLETQIISM